MQLKKIFSFLLVVALLVSCMVVTASAENTNIFEVGVEAVTTTPISNTPNIYKNGEIITVTVKATQNTGITAVRFKINYDTDLFEYVSHTDKDLIKGDQVSNHEGYMYYLMNNGAMATNATGDLFTFDLKIKDDVCGDAAITASLYPKNDGITPNPNNCYNAQNSVAVPFASREFTTTIHNIDVENSVVTDPTCTEKGYTTHTCDTCKENIVSDYVDANGHTEGAVVVENNLDPTCTEKGSYDNVVYCTVCSEELSRETVTVDANGHTLTHFDQIDPQPEVEGVLAYDRCEICEKLFIEETEVTPDDLIIEALPLGFWKGNNTDGWWFKYYYDADGYAIGWEQIDGVWYHFDANGWMQTGWQLLGKTWYYFETSGAMVTDWQKINNVWYYFDADGAMQTGWEQIEEVWYYLDADGAMQTGWQKIGKVWYYFETSGAMVTDWQKINNVWYYFDADGAMQTGWVLLDDVWYYLDASGAMVTGSRTIGGKVYNFNASGVCLNP